MFNPVLKVCMMRFYLTQQCVLYHVKLNLVADSVVTSNEQHDLRKQEVVKRSVFGHGTLE